MSKLAHGAPERDCTQRCCSRQHGDSLVAAASKRGTPDAQLASFARWLCGNCGRAVDRSGRTMLHLAASCGRAGVARWLVRSKDASVNARDLESGYTPLHRSIFYGQIHVAAALMKLGASITAMDFEDLTPLEIAMKDRLPIVSYDLNGPCEVYIWGTNANYTLGTGTQASRPQPELLDLFRKQNISVKQVVMHKFHSMFVAHDGRVFSCGHGQGGRLGLDSEKAFLMPCPVKLPVSQATGLHDACVLASAGRDHTVLLMESGQVLTCGLNTHHQLGHAPPPAHLLTPRPLAQKATRAAGEVRGVCAARFHTVVWGSAALLTCGLNAGQLGHPRAAQERSVVLPRLVSSLNHKDCNITHVAASDGATVVVMKRGDIYVLHEYQCRKIASRQLDVEKVEVVGGHLDSRLDAGVLMDRGGQQLRVLVLTKAGKLQLWQESSLQLTRCIFNLNRLVIVKDIAINRQHLLLVTADGEAFEGEVKARKSRRLHQSPETQPKVPQNKWSAFNEFLEKGECEVVALKKIPHIHRAVSVTSDLKGRNFAVIQAHPKACLLEVPQVETSDMREHMLSLLQEAHEDDTIHDVEFQTGQGRRVFAAHKFLVASRSEPLTKLVAEAAGRCDGGVPRVELAGVHPQIFQQLLQFMYTNTCDLLRPGPCAIQVPKSSPSDNKNVLGNKPNVDVNEMLDSTTFNSSTVSAYEVILAEGKNKKNKAKQHFMKKVGEDNEGNFCDPIRLAQEAAKKFGLITLQKKLDGVRYENGLIVSKNNRPCQPAEVSFDHKKHKELYDVTLRSEDGKELKAHKCVLAARLDYFSSMFGGGWAEAQTNSKALSIPVPFAILEVLVDFLYRNDATSVSNSEDLDFVCNVLVLSDQLLIKRLKEICEVALANLITLKNVAHFLQFSETYNADQLKLCCMQYVCLNLPAILESRVLDLLSEDLLECLSKYYCELHPVMSRRIITPYADAPSDDLVRCVWESYPVSWEDGVDAGFIEEKHKMVKGMKKKTRVRKTSSSEGTAKSGNIRLRNESVSSNEDVSQHCASPISFEELTEKQCYPSIMPSDLSDSKDITLSLSKITGHAQETCDKENNQSLSWVKVLNHSSKQQKVVQARLKVVSAIKECPEIMGELPEKFTNLSAALKVRPVESSKLQPAKENVATSPSSSARMIAPKAKSQSPVFVPINTENFPLLRRSPPCLQDNVPTIRSPDAKLSGGETRRVARLSQKQRKKLAWGQSSSPPADQAGQRAGAAWGGAASPEGGSPAASFTLLDVMQQTRQASAPIPTPACRKLSWAVPSAISPPEQSPPALSNPWQKMGTPPAAALATSPPPMSFTDIVADEKKQRDNWTRMRAKPLQLTQLEDKAMEDLLVFYNAAGAMDERITVHRVSTGAIAMPVWITSHH
ncbi:inhibitor of Bruton tyrosine kinase [Bacillus rossius redtenbacheri]|uniref:inhibitor of Bruton tyrosine kinase n=1 Tax=Bacillus rossius redtenbacheri TaxID=93214 RepID=UPI002FDE1811